MIPSVRQRKRVIKNGITLLGAAVQVVAPDNGRLALDNGSGGSAAGYYSYESRSPDS